MTGKIQFDLIVSHLFLMIFFMLFRVFGKLRLEKKAFFHIIAIDERSNKHEYRI
jgi:hypothetical protein